MTRLCGRSVVVASIWLALSIQTNTVQATSENQNLSLRILRAIDDLTTKVSDYFQRLQLTQREVRSLQLATTRLKVTQSRRIVAAESAVTLELGVGADGFCAVAGFRVTSRPDGDVSCVVTRSGETWLGVAQNVACEITCFELGFGLTGEERVSNDVIPGYKIGDGVDIPGFDFQVFTNLTLRACANECSKVGQCRAFTFDRRSGWCFLKSIVGESNNVDFAITGYRE